MAKKILQRKEKVLHHKTLEVPVSEIKSVKIKKVLREMSAALKSQHDGVAIAAPQIGYGLRIFVVSGKIFEAGFSRRGVSQADGATRPLSLKPSEGEQGISAESEIKDMIFINPKISKLSRDKEWVPEGCLSVRWLYGQTFRHKKATVVAYDEMGKKFTRGASGLLAQIFQHETDHLDGKLFIDLGERVKELKEENPNESK